MHDIDFTDAFCGRLFFAHMLVEIIIGVVTSRPPARFAVVNGYRKQGQQTVEIRL